MRATSRPVGSRPARDDPEQALAAQLAQLGLGSAPAGQVYVLSEPAYERARTRRERTEARFYAQRIFGEGACFYRAAAHQIMLRRFGVDLGGGISLPAAVLRAEPQAYLRSSYARAPLDAVLLNALAEWLKFYVAMLLGSTVPVQRIDWRRGIEGLEGVVPVRDAVREYVRESRSPQQALQKATGTLPERRGAYYVPSLDAVTRYLLYLRLAAPTLLDAGDGTAARPPLCARYRWADVRAHFLPVLAVPWDAPAVQSEFARAAERLPAARVLPLFDAVTREWRDDNAGALPLLLEAAQSLGAWRRYVRENLRQLQCYAGQEEALALAALLRDAGLPFRNLITYLPVGDNGDDDDEEHDDASGYARPVLLPEAALDTRDDLSVQYVNENHYDSLVPLLQRRDGVQRAIPSRTVAQLAAEVFGAAQPSAGAGRVPLLPHEVARCDAAQLTRYLRNEIRAPATDALPRDATLPQALAAVRQVLATAPQLLVEPVSPWFYDEQRPPAPPERAPPAKDEDDSEETQLDEARALLVDLLQLRRAEHRAAPLEPLFSDEALARYAAVAAGAQHNLRDEPIARAWSLEYDAAEQRRIRALLADLLREAAATGLTREQVLASADLRTYFLEEVTAPENLRAEVVQRVWRRLRAQS